MLKKVLSLLLATTMLVGVLSGCGNTQEPSVEQPPAAEEAAAEEVATEDVVEIDWYVD